MPESILRRWAVVALMGTTIGVAGGGPSGAVAAEERRLSDGVYADAQASRGRRVYRQTCASCHASNLQGGEMGPGLAGDPFLGPWSGAGLAELMALIQQTMPQDNPGGLDEQDYLDVLAFMLQANDFPAGDEELTLEAVDEIVID